MLFIRSLVPLVALAQVGIAYDIPGRELEGRQVVQSGCTTISGTSVVCSSVISYTFTLPAATTITASMSCSPAVLAASSSSLASSNLAASSSRGFSTTPVLITPTSTTHSTISSATAPSSVTPSSTTPSTTTSTTPSTTPSTTLQKVAVVSSATSSASTSVLSTSMSPSRSSAMTSSSSKTISSTFSSMISSLSPSMSKTASSSTTSTVASPTSNNFVFAHYLVGVAANYSISDWQDDVAKAQAAHIDAFALNIAAGDSWTDTQLPLAFQAAQKAGFKVFFSFDYSGSAWAASDVITKLQTWSSNSAYFQYKSLPFVSSFEGPGNAGDWPTIRASVPCFFVPDWASVGYGSFGNYLGYVDGAFSWDSWPVGASNMNSNEDQGWISALGGKPYMMGLSPWFYTNLPQYSKNWAWRGDSLLHDRWQEIYSLQPQFVEIISWNDYGESHYIGPIRPSGIPDGCSHYVSNNPHDAWRSLLPYYIDTYKYGSATVTTEQVIFWYRNAPVATGSSGGTVGNAPWQSSVAVTAVLQDLIQVNALIKSLPATVTVQIGSNSATSFTVSSTGMGHFTVPFNGQTGNVSVAIVRSGTTVVSATGMALLSTPADGLANYNAWVGSS